MTEREKISGASDAPVVALEGAEMSFGPVHALRAASIVIGAGECVGLVGHNGAGKSTLANVINGRLTPTGGAVLYRDGDVARNNSQNAQVAGVLSVFQELSLCPNLTVLENLRIPYRNMPRKGWRRMAQQKITDALDLVFPGHGIRPHATVGDLTIAERQMVEIAIAFAERDRVARLVILDEPSSRLDPVTEQRIDRAVQRLLRGRTSIIIAHRLGTVQQVDDVMILADGEIQEYGERQQLVSNPDSVFSGLLKTGLEEVTQ